MSEQELGDHIIDIKGFEDGYTIYARVPTRGRSIVIKGIPAYKLEGITKAIALIATKEADLSILDSFTKFGVTWD